MDQPLATYRLAPSGRRVKTDPRAASGDARHANEEER